MFIAVFRAARDVVTLMKRVLYRLERSVAAWLYVAVIESIVVTRLALVVSAPTWIAANWLAAVV
ncbi:hypothetical protein D3C85_1762900 [compost metagenome]